MTIEKSREPEAFKNFERDGWEANSAGYEQHFARLTSQTVPATLDAVGATQGMRLLDVCTGPAMLAKAAVERDAEVVGLDFSAEAIEIAKRNVPRAEFQQGDAQVLPFDDRSFDAVVCGYGVIHVPEPEKALSEMHRVLRPGGRLATSVWEAPKPSNGFGLIFGAIKSHGSLDVSLPHGPDFFQFSDQEKLAAALEGAGFHAVSVQSVEQVWAFDESSGLISALLEGTVRARGLFLAQTESARSTISEAIEEGMTQFRSPDGGFRVPVPALLGAGTN